MKRLAKVGKWIRIALGSVVIAFIGAFVISFMGVVYNVGHAKSDSMSRIDAVGGSDKVLWVCREMMANTTFTNLPHGNEMMANDPVIPETIAKLDVNFIRVHNDCMLILLKYPARSGLYVFKEGVPEFGTSKITNGLWFWGGDLSSGTQSNFNAHLKH